ncbi:amidase [Colletotrichum acutatum]
MVLPFTEGISQVLIALPSQSTDVFGIEDDEPARDILLKEISIALMKTPMWSAAGPGTISAIEAAAVILRERGIKVEEISFPPEMSDPKELERL